MSSIPRRLVHFRTVRGYSVNRLAKVSGLTEGTIRGWEKGVSPRVDNLERVAACLNVTVVELLQDQELQKPGLAKVRMNLDEMESLMRETRKILDASGVKNDG